METVLMNGSNNNQENLVAQVDFVLDSNAEFPKLEKQPLQRKHRPCPLIRLQPQAQNDEVGEENVERMIVTLGDYLLPALHQLGYFGY